jgi:hypothetical protein
MVAATEAPTRRLLLGTVVCRSTWPAITFQLGAVAPEAPTAALIAPSQRGFHLGARYRWNVSGVVGSRSPPSQRARAMDTDGETGNR